MSYNSENDKAHSSMRRNNSKMTNVVIGLLGIVGIYIIIMAVKHEGVNDWGGLAAFVGALFIGLTGLYGAKAYQKQYEK
jgi:uncharacterized membrane protein YjjB (DUF3815 family)